MSSARKFVLPHVARMALAAWCRHEPFGDWPAPSGWKTRYSDSTVRGRLRELLGRDALTARQSAELRELEERVVYRAVKVSRPSREARLAGFRAQRAAEAQRKLREARNALVQHYEDEIVRRGGETRIVGAYGTAHLDVSDEQMGCVVLHAEGWRQYSRRFGARRASLCYLCGEDSNGPWAVRVPGTIRRVKSALDWITPTAVRKAQERGHKVLRQGDVYAVESRTDRAQETAARLDARAAAHVWDSAARTLRHQPRDGRPHGDLAVPFPCAFYQQRVYAMGRSGRRGAGD